MLFDIRNPGRRRTIKIVYVFLALLMGAGLILFGIGGATSGGLLDAFKNQTGTSSGTATFNKKVKSLQLTVRRNPKDANAWAQLAKLRFQVAGAGAGYDQANSTFTDKGKQELLGVEQAWNKYLSLNPKHPDDTIAIQMVQALGPTGLNKLSEAANAMEIVATERPPSPQLYAQLAIYAYAANDTIKGDRASQKAESLATSKTQRATIKATLAQAKSAGQQQAIQAATGNTTTNQSLPTG